MLNLARLRILDEVVRRGSLSAAADSLNYSQSAVSQAIATLESEVGVSLLERLPRGVRPTAAGAALATHAEGIFTRLEAAEEEVAAIAGLRGGSLRMASFPSAGATLMPLAIARFRAAHPDVELSLAEGEPEDIAPRLRGGEFDLVLLYEFPGESELSAKIQRFDLLSDPLDLALPKVHSLADRERIRLEDLKTESWIQTSANSPCARHVMRRCHEAGFEPRVSFESDDYQTVQGLVAAGVGIALVPGLALPSVREDITVRPLHPRSPERTVLAATPRGAPVTPAVATMLDILRGTVEHRPNGGT